MTTRFFFFFVSFDFCEVNVAFSGEECGGRCLDLHELHNKFLNLSKDQPPVDYMTYLETFHEFDKIPTEKKTAAYKQYLKDLLDYLLDFCHRALPLDNIAILLQRAEQRYKDSLATSAAAENGSSGPTPMEINGQQVPVTTADNPLYCLACTLPSLLLLFFFYESFFIILLDVFSRISHDGDR